MRQAVYPNGKPVDGLDRARAFAMHAIGSSTAFQATLWAVALSTATGDLGLAVYLVDWFASASEVQCLTRNAAT